MIKGRYVSEHLSDRWQPHRYASGLHVISLLFYIFPVVCPGLSDRNPHYIPRWQCNFRGTSVLTRGMTIFSSCGTSMLSPLRFLYLSADSRGRY
jgi:hypothetical protein